MTASRPPPPTPPARLLRALQHALRPVLLVQLQSVARSTPAPRLNEECDLYANASASSGARSTDGSTYRGARTSRRKRALVLVALAALARRVVGVDARQALRH
ncbi:hypothetical protein C8J57DRAFT_1539522 [Mycena rebaudengoi]|nr:hypothetical protein C8J57DRAFT_1539522 [Mycena rebaudengoi]